MGYQIMMRCSGATYILSRGFMSNAMKIEKTNSGRQR